LKRFLFALALSACAYAVPITFTLRGTATGSANGVPFIAVSFSVAYSADTSFQLPNGGGSVDFYPQAITFISITGIGNGTFTNTFYLNTRTGTSFVNLTDPSSGNNFLLIYPGLANYPFRAAFGPVSVVLDPKTPLPTNLSSTLGNIRFTSLDNLTFGAVTPTVPPAPTPIPSTLILAVTGLAGAALLFGFRGTFGHGLPSGRLLRNTSL
jgi:hypothetical protein